MKKETPVLIAMIVGLVMGLYGIYLLIFQHLFAMNYLLLGPVLFVVGLLWFKTPDDKVVENGKT